MKLGELKIIGKQRRKKDGKPVSYVLHCEALFEDWEGGEGFKSVSEWTRVDCSDLKPGMIIQPYYSKAYNGSAVFSGFDIVQG